jgi:hypothetical protein
MPSPIPRKLYSCTHVDEVSADTKIFRYFPYRRFEDFISRAALYFRRIDHFKDNSDGTVPLALWSIEHPVIKQWYDDCKVELFVNCWNLDEAELRHMWDRYAGNYGVRVASTAGRLSDELSHPSLVDAPIPSEYSGWAARSDVVFHIGNTVPHDSFTVGRVRYMNFDTTNVYDLMKEGLSNATPAFRKKHGFAPENEFRAVLRPASASCVDAKARGDIHVFVPVRVDHLIEEVRFFPADDSAFEQRVRRLLCGLRVPVVRSSFSSTTT